MCFIFFFYVPGDHRDLPVLTHSFPTRRSSDLAMDAHAQTVTMITAAVDETALAADSMSATISAIRQDTDVVASEIDALERGFSSVEGKLATLREASAELSRRVA